jgi:hypothetical protein
MPPRRETIPKQKLKAKRIRTQTHQGVETRLDTSVVAQARVVAPQDQVIAANRSTPIRVNFGYCLSALSLWLIFVTLKRKTSFIQSRIINCWCLEFGKRCGNGLDRGLAEADGQPDSHGGTLANLAFQVNDPPVFVDNLTHKDHAQTGPTYLGGKVGFKDLAEYLGGHSPAGILDYQAGVAHIHGSGHVNLPPGGGS